MKIKFYGAAGCVTGSCHILTINGKKILLDCGLYQGHDDKLKENETFDFEPKEIDYVLLSHAHIDHSGRIPFLYKNGFKGEIICTEATKDLCSVMLPDSGHIQEMETEWKNRKRIRQGLPPIDPLYTANMANLSMYLFKGVKYDELIEVFEGFKIRFKDAGHLLGSSIIEMFIKEKDNDEVKLVFTGDLGNINIPIIKDPTKIDRADYVIMETTYGDRLHDNVEQQLEELVKIIKTTFEKGGNVIIPSFAVGRTQELLYALKKYIDESKLKNLKVYVDSPLASESTEIFKRHEDYYDEEAAQMVKSEGNPLEFDGLIFTKSPEESAMLNKIQKGALVISASGMCEAGRIKHHLKHNLWRRECSIVFVGYQAEGTLGRMILDGAKKVKLFGEEIAVNASIYNLPALSGHADRNGLYNWISSLKEKPKNVMLVHGSPEAQNSFNDLITSKGYSSKIMQKGQSVEINGLNKIIGLQQCEVNDNITIKTQLVDMLDKNDVNNMDKEVLLTKIIHIIFGR